MVIAPFLAPIWILWRRTEPAPEFVRQDLAELTIDVDFCDVCETPSFQRTSDDVRLQRRERTCGDDDLDSIVHA
jgi:hypothetical protein